MKTGVLQSVCTGSSDTQGNRPYLVPLPLPTVANPCKSRASRTQAVLFACSFAGDTELGFGPVPYPQGHNLLTCK